jgi:hypothetical protein
MQTDVRRKSFARSGILRTILTLVCAVPFIASAQAAVYEGDTPPETIAPPAGTVSCFDHYHFGSVQAKITATVSSAVSGTPVTFAGTIENENPYPITDGTLFVKIFRTRPGIDDANGPDVVDQFVVKSGITIPADSSVPVSFSWQIPAYAKAGDYSVATYFSVSRKFNLLGLSFTDDVVGNTAPFTVSGDVAGNVSFDKAGVTIDGNPYLFAAYPPRVSASDPVAIVATARNTSDTAQTARVHWQVYQWDAMLRENLLHEEDTTISVPAHGSAPIKLTVTDSKYPVYLALGTLSWKDSKSVIGVRFVRDGVDRLRINFPGITKYPLTAGQPATLFSCLHNSGSTRLVKGGRLELTLSDMQGRTIHTYTYSGDVMQAMQGVADTFTPDRTYDSFVLDARLYDASGFVDEAHLVYDCRVLGGTDCAPESFDSDTDSLSSLMKSIDPRTGVLGTLGIVALLVLVLAFSLLRKPSQQLPEIPRI